jgi:transposase-like protein
LTTTQPRRTRRNLTEQQKSELARLYTDTATPLPEIKQRFGIAESSLYRLLQQRGVALRGRTTRATPARSSNGRPAPAAGVSFRVSFAVVRVVKATDIQDAIRQAHGLGATEVLQVERA